MGIIAFISRIKYKNQLNFYFLLVFSIGCKTAVYFIHLMFAISRSYQFTRQEISEILHKLLAARHLVFSAPDQVGRALDAFEHGRGGGADYLIREHAHHFGCDHIATFDQALLKENGFIKP